MISDLLVERWTAIGF